MPLLKSSGNNDQPHTHDWRQTVVFLKTISKKINKDFLEKQQILVLEQEIT